MATAEVPSSSSTKAAILSRDVDGALGKSNYDGAASSDHLRDVVFSTQMREVERRSLRLEEKLAKELSHLRLEMTARMEALERHVQSETEAAAVRLAQESQDRQLTDKQTIDELHQAKTMLTKDLDGLRQQLAKSERDLRQSLLDSAKTLAAEVHRVHEELTAELSEEVHALEDGKVARSGLAAMLSELIVRLNAGPGGGGGRFDK